MTRIRRTAEEARALILEVAREHVLTRGPAALRLKEVAADAGVSHPTVLHHFGSREGLVAAVVGETMSRLDDELELLLESTTELDPEPVVRAMADVIGRRGFGRLIAWLSLSDQPGALPSGRLCDVIDAVHAARMRLLPEGEDSPDYDDSSFLSMLVTYAILGEAIMGPDMRANLPAERIGDRDDFYARLVGLVRQWIRGT